MARASFQQSFRSQIEKAKVDIDSNIKRLIQNIHLLRNEIMRDIQALENEEVQREEELTRLKHVLSDTASKNNMKFRVADIYDQIQCLLPENNSRLLVIDWDSSSEYALLNTLCKVSVKRQLNEQKRIKSPEETLTQSMYHFNIREIDPHNSISDFYPKSPVSRPSSYEEEQTILTLEQKYKQQSDQSYNSFSKRYTLEILQRPQGISIDDNTDHVYVADFDAHCIRVFEREGSYIREFTHNRMIHPFGICVSCSLDRVYITVVGRHAVHCYKLDGTFTKEITYYGASNADINNPAGITMDSNERVYVCVRGRDCVAVFTRYLLFITMLTTLLSDPRDVRVVGSEVAILHDGEYCVSFFTRGGVFLRRVVKKGNNKQKVGDPSFFCIDSDNNILITDSKHDCIKIYRSTGFHICNTTSERGSNREFVKLVGISLFDDGSIVSLCDINGGQLRVFEL